MEHYQVRYTPSENNTFIHTYIHDRYTHRHNIYIYIYVHIYTWCKVSYITSYALITSSYEFTTLYKSLSMNPLT